MPKLLRLGGRIFGQKSDQMHNRNSWIRIFLYINLLTGAMFSTPRCNAHAISHKANQRTEAVADIVIASLSYCAEFEDRDGLHHPWVYTLPPKLVSNYTQVVRKAKSAGFSRVGGSWLRPVRVHAYVCLDFSDEVLTEASATLFLTLSKHRWIVDTKASSFEVGE